MGRWMEECNGVLLCPFFAFGWWGRLPFHSSPCETSKNWCEKLSVSSSPVNVGNPCAICLFIWVWFKGIWLFDLKVWKTRYGVFGAGQLWVYENWLLEVMRMGEQFKSYTCWTLFFFCSYFELDCFKLQRDGEFAINLPENYSLGLRYQTEFAFN